MLLGVKSGDGDPTVMSVRQFHTCVRRAADQVAAEKSGRRRRVANALRPDHYHSGPGPEAQRAPRALLAGVSCCSRKRAGTVAGAPRDFPHLRPPASRWPVAASGRQQRADGRPWVRDGVPRGGTRSRAGGGCDAGTVSTLTQENRDTHKGQHAFSAGTGVRWDKWPSLPMAPCAPDPTSANLRPTALSLCG